jgi:hypothetical protein
MAAADEVPNQEGTQVSPLLGGSWAYSTFVEMQNMIREAIGQHILWADVSIDLISKRVAASAEAAMERIALKPATAPKVSQRWI